MTDEPRREDPAVNNPELDDELYEEVGETDDSIIGKAFVWSIAAFLLIGGTITAVAFVLKQPPPPPPEVQPEYVPPEVYEDTSAEAPLVNFTDITQEAGIDFVHENGAAGDKLLPESMGGGCAFFDADGDGDQDLLFVNSTIWPDNRTAGEALPTMALYRNDGSGHFENATAGSGLDVSFYGMGVAVGDVDNDGDSDLFITAVGPNRLFRNDGGTFTDITEEAGVAGGPDQWSTSTSFLDIDNDGLLDLFVCNYIRWSKEIDFQVDFRFAGVGRAYGPPTNFEGAHCYLYHNRGDGTFEDISAAAGMYVENMATGLPVGKALGVSPLDVNGDGWIDILVANDTTQNFLFVNQGDRTFVESGVEYGIAFDREGKATGAMGIDGGRYRNDDDLGFFIGNFANEMTSLYMSQGDPTLYADEAIGEGIGSPTRLMLTFGLFLFDYDLDGRLDLFQVNGHLEEEINVIQPSQRYEQPPQLFWNGGARTRGCFVAVDPEQAGDLNRPLVGRGAAYADIDGDGDLDILITQLGRAPLLVRNEQQTGHRAVRVRLIGKQANRDAIGAWIHAESGGTVQQRQVMPTRSYLSQVELPVTLGLNDAAQVDRLTVEWPGSDAEVIEKLTAGKTYTITQGEGVTGEVAFGS